MNENKYLKVKEVTKGVLKFHPKNGGWGTPVFYIYPNMPKSQPSGNSHMWYVLGTPDVVQWRGREYGCDGHGLGIRTDEGWASWYNAHGELSISIEQLQDAGIFGVFSVEIGSGGIKIVLLTLADGVLGDLVRGVKAIELSESDIEAIRKLVA